MNRSNSEGTQKFHLGEDAPDFFMDESLMGDKAGASYPPEVAADYTDETVMPQKISIADMVGEESAPAEEYYEETYYDENAGEYYDEDSGEYYDEEYYDEYDGNYDENYDGYDDYEDEEPQPVKKKKKWPLWTKILIVIIALLLIVIIGIVIMVNSMLNKIDRTQAEPMPTMEVSEVVAFEEEVIAEEESAYAEAGVEYVEIDESEIEWTEPVETIADDENYISILLVGQDARSSESRARSDTMILVTVDKENKKIYLTSFLRDLYVQVPGYEDTRLNHSFAYGGMTLLSETLEKNFGVQIDNTVVVNFSSFTKVIDILGGVDIELTSGEAQIVGVGSGMQHLNGTQALEYARIRKLDNDFGRTERQRKVLGALIESAKSMSLTTVTDLVNEIFPLVSTDMSNTDILGYAAELLPLLTDAEMITSSIPAEGTYTFNTIRGMSVIVADMEKNREILKSALEG